MLPYTPPSDPGPCDNKYTRVKVLLLVLVFLFEEEYRGLAGIARRFNSVEKGRKRVSNNYVCVNVQNVIVVDGLCRTVIFTNLNRRTLFFFVPTPNGRGTMNTLSSTSRRPAQVHGNSPADL